jgi:hypothetical protein
MHGGPEQGLQEKAAGKYKKDCTNAKRVQAGTGVGNLPETQPIGIEADKQT